jgi:membrane-associated phospholipid phosphatase
MKNIIARHKYCWTQKTFWQSFIVGVFLLAASLFFNHVSSIYVDHRAGAYVQDIFLDNLPVVNVDDILNDGVIIYSVLMIFFIIIKPERISVVLKSLATFVFIRAIFTTLTHLGPAPSQTYLDPDDLLIKLNAGRDMFFSGHTGVPFLMALIFWNENKIIRDISIAASIIFGASVLLGHLHYSIDVFAAFFITYTIFCLSKKFFAKDFLLLNKKYEQNNE